MSEKGGTLAAYIEPCQRGECRDRIGDPDDGERNRLQVEREIEYRHRSRGLPRCERDQHEERKLSGEESRGTRQREREDLHCFRKRKRKAQARKESGAHYGWELDAEVKQGTGDHSQSDSRKTHGGIEKDDSCEDADVIEDRAYRVEDKFPMRLRHRGEKTRETKQYRLEQEYP